MTIPASDLVSVTSAVLGAGGNSLTLGGLFLSTCSYLPVNTMVAFTSPDDVLTFFGASSDEYAASVTYFAGFTNSAEKPAAMNFFRYAEDSAVAGFLRGVAITQTLTQLKTITNGSITLNVDGVTASHSAVNFSAATSLSDVASILQTALNAIPY